MFGAISLTSAQVGATVTEGDISGGAGFVKGCDTGVFSYVVRKGHLARIYTDNRRALETRMRVSINGDVLKVIDRAKMVAVKFKGPTAPRSPDIRHFSLDGVQHPIRIMTRETGTDVIR